MKSWFIFRRYKSVLFACVLLPVVTQANQPPAVRITTPQNGQYFNPHTNIVIEAQPQDADGMLDIRYVEFYADAKRIGVSTNNPFINAVQRFICLWTNLVPGEHTLTARVYDSIGQSGNSDPVVVRIVTPPDVAGYLRRLLYTNISGLSVSNLTTSPKFPNHPDLNMLIAPFEAPFQNLPNYGQKIYGYVHPPRSGPYRFFMAADDQAVLYLSPDSYASNKIQIAHEPTWRGPRAWVGPEGLTAPHISQPILLEQGRKYYIEALHKQGAGGENLAVAWQLPGDPVPANGSDPIPAAYLSTDPSVPLTNTAPYVALSRPASNSVFSTQTPIQVGVLAHDIGGYVQQVEIFAGNQWLGRAQESPYMSSAQWLLVWSNAPAGQYLLRAVARDNSGLSSTSAPVPILVTNALPKEAFVRTFTNTLVSIRAEPGATAKVYAVEDMLPPGWFARYISHDGVFDSATRKVKFGPFFDNVPRVLQYHVAASTPTTGPGFFSGTGSVDGRNIPITGQSSLVLPYPHPAELSANWRIEIAEVTAYGSAWRAGRAWQNPPNPIPMDYVTRAGMLWRSGEAYKMNAFGTAPMWWVPTNMPIALAPAFGGAAGPSASRNVSGAGSVQVRLSVSGGAGTMAYAVAEKIPAGCTVTSVTAGGLVDPLSGEIRWGPFLDSSARELEYVLQDALAEQLDFQGSASFDGQSVAVVGASKYELPPRLEWRSGADRKELHLWSRAGLVCVVESSADLLTWKPLMTVTNTTGLMKLDTPTRPEPGGHYFRLVPVR